MMYGATMEVNGVLSSPKDGPKNKTRAIQYCWRHKSDRHAGIILCATLHRPDCTYLEMTLERRRVFILKQILVAHYAWIKALKAKMDFTGHCKDQQWDPFTPLNPKERNVEQEIKLLWILQTTLSVVVVGNVIPTFTKAQWIQNFWKTHFSTCDAVCNQRWRGVTWITTVYPRQHESTLPCGNLWPAQSTGASLICLVSMFQQCAFVYLSLQLEQGSWPKIPMKS